jgi:hypothetical protein
VRSRQVARCQVRDRIQAGRPRTALQMTPVPSALPGFVLIISIAGAISDWRYKRRGGKKPSKRERLLFLLVLVLVAALYVSFVLVGGSEGASPAIIGHTILPIAIVLFGSWELGRWRVRSKNPLPSDALTPAVSAVPKLLCANCGCYAAPSSRFCPKCGSPITS